MEAVNNKLLSKLTFNIRQIYEQSMFLKEVVFDAF